MPSLLGSSTPQAASAGTSLLGGSTPVAAPAPAPISGRSLLGGGASSSAPAQGSSLLSSSASPPVNNDGPSTSVDDLIRKHAKDADIDPEWAYRIGRTESGGLSDRAHARSSAGAIGVMQLMPGTAKELGVKDIYNADQNIAGGIKYLKQLLKKYKGNYAHAAAAYNVGPGAVDYSLAHGTPLPLETQNYVRSTASPGSMDALTKPVLPQPKPQPRTGALAPNAPNTRQFHAQGEKPGVPKRGFLETAGAYVDSGFIAMDAFERGASGHAKSGDPLDEILNPTARHAGVQELKKALKLFQLDPAGANEQYGFLSKEQNTALARYGNAGMRKTAQWWLKHPHKAEAAAFVAEFYNPVNDVLGLGFGQLGRAAKLIANQSAAGRRILNIGSPFKSIAVEHGDKAKHAVMSFMNRVPFRAKHGEDIAQHIYGKISPEETYDVARRAENLEHAKNGRPQNPVKFPNRPDLDHRAILLHKTTEAMTNEQLTHGAIEQNRVFKQGFYHPMSGAYKDPHYDEETAEFVAKIKGKQGTGSGTNFRSGSAGKLGGRKTNFGIDDILKKDAQAKAAGQVAGQLNDDFSLQGQLSKYLRRRGANVEIQKLAQELKTVGAAADRRFLYKGKLIGVGDDGEEKTDKIAEAVAHKKAVVDAEAVTQVGANKIRARALGGYMARAQAEKRALNVANAGLDRATNLTTRTEQRGRAVLEQQVQEQQRLAQAAQQRAAKAQADLGKGATAARAKTLAAELDAVERHTATLDSLKARVTTSAKRAAGVAEPTIAKTPELSRIANKLADVTFNKVGDKPTRDALRGVFDAIKGSEDHAGTQAGKVADSIPVARLQAELKDAMAKVSRAGIDKSGGRTLKALQDLSQLVDRQAARTAGRVDRNVGKIVDPALRNEAQAGKSVMQADQRAIASQARLAQKRADAAMKLAYDKAYKEAYKRHLGIEKRNIDLGSPPHIDGWVHAKDTNSSLGVPALRNAIISKPIAEYFSDTGKGSAAKKLTEMLGGEAGLAQGPAIESVAAKTFDAYSGVAYKAMLANPFVHRIGNVATNKSAALDEKFPEKMVTYANAVVDSVLSTMELIPGIGEKLAKQAGRPVDALRARFWGGAQAYADAVRDAIEHGATAESAPGASALGGDSARIRGSKTFNGFKNPKEFIDQQLTYLDDWNTRATFGARGEEREAVELFTKFQKKFGMTKQEAAYATREALGNIRNAKSGSWQSKIEMFYSWMKSNTAFWLAKFFTGPAQWNAPEQGLRRQNEYSKDPLLDDPRNPEKDFTFYDSSTGRRTRIPMAYNMLSDVANIITPQGMHGLENVPGMAEGPTTFERTRDITNFVSGRLLPQIDLPLRIAETVSNPQSADPALPMNYQSVMDRDSPSDKQAAELATNSLARLLPVPLIGGAVDTALRRGSESDPFADAASAAGFGVREARLSDQQTRALYEIQRHREKALKGARSQPNLAGKEKAIARAQKIYETQRDAILGKITKKQAQAILAKLAAGDGAGDDDP